MDISFKQFVAMLRFLWSHAPPKLKYVLLPLAIVAGFSRDYVMIVVNKAAASPLDVALGFWLPLFLIAFVVVIGSFYFYQITTVMVTTYVTNTVRMKLIQGLMKVQPNFLDRQQHGAIYHILTTDVTNVANFTATALGLLPSFVFLGIAVPQLFYYSLIAGCFAALVMLGGTLSYYLQQKAMARLNNDARSLDVAYFERVSEMLKGFRELRLNMKRRDSFAAATTRVLTLLRETNIKVSRIYEGGEAAVHALKFLLFGGIVFLVPYYGSAEMATTYQVLTLVLFSLTPFEQIISSYPSVIGTLVCFARISELGSKLEQFRRVTEHVPEHPAGFHRITVRSGSAIHDSRETSSFVLGPFDFSIRSGEIVFLIGNNGSGKTTFMNVMAGLLDLQEGSIEVDGQPLAAEMMAEYRSRISAIFSQFHVFRQLHGLEHVTGEEAAAAIVKVGLAGITDVSNGEVTRLDLSAGQKRRLALAIALLEDRDFLILDEFVADQDPTQREFFFRHLLPELKARGKTLIVSTHDLHWVDCCDRLFRFENGKITEVSVADVIAGHAA
ncbi:MAG: ATP-binding cassette domain-containing protein [Rhizobiales bacterium]|nr:ATP-binding cassette domain-containing protein [Hyphomicrobiales bacterium]